MEGEESAPHHPAAVSLILDTDRPGEEREREKKKMIRKTQTEQRQNKTTKQKS